jgi:hypothetical protein
LAYANKIVKQKTKKLCPFELVSWWPAVAKLRTYYGATEMWLKDGMALERTYMAHTETEKSTFNVF